mgnify:FL=1
MCTIKLNATQVAAIYKGGNEEARKALKDSLGEQFSTILPITERVKTFEDAVGELGNEHPLVKVYQSIKYGYCSELVGKDLLAYTKLSIICEALNEGWHPQFTLDERRWYPYYELFTNEEIEEMTEEEKGRVVGRASSYAGASGGLVCSYASYVSSNSCTSLGSRLAFKSEELAGYAGKTFIDIYKDFVMFTPEQVCDAEDN